MKKFGKVAVGGTFDELHKGHKALLGKAFEIGEKVIIGLSSDEFALKMCKPHQTAGYTERKKELEAYLQEHGLAQKAQIVPLNDPYGLTIKGEGLDALVVSKETEATANRINEIRRKEKLPMLKIVAVNMVPAENSNPISTTRIRKGEIDREGHLLRSMRVR
jgi:cytidyltransferase-like protein